MKNTPNYSKLSKRVVSHIDFYPSIQDSDQDNMGFGGDISEMQHSKVSSFNKNVMSNASSKQIIVSTTSSKSTKKSNPNSAIRSGQTPPISINFNRYRQVNKSSEKQENYSQRPLSQMSLPLNKDKFNLNTKDLFSSNQQKSINDLQSLSQKQQRQQQQQSIQNHYQNIDQLQVVDKDFSSNINNISTLPAYAQKNKLLSYLHIHNKSFNNSISQSAMNSNRLNSEANNNISSNKGSFVTGINPTSHQSVNERSKSRSTKSNVKSQIVYSQNVQVKNYKQTRNQSNDLSSLNRINNNMNNGNGNNNASIVVSSVTSANSNNKFLLNYGLKNINQKGGNSTEINTTKSAQSIQEQSKKISANEELAQQKQHSEYNNNEEDYQKFKKDEVIKSIFKKRKEKLQSMDISKDHLSHQVSSQTFDAVNGMNNNNTTIGNSLAQNYSHIDYTEPQEYSITKTGNKQKAKKTISERTHTPPPPSSIGRIGINKNKFSLEKSAVTGMVANQNSSSFYSKKQTPYINPKNPDECGSNQVSPNKVEKNIKTSAVQQTNNTQSKPSTLYNDVMSNRSSKKYQIQPPQSQQDMQLASGGLSGLTSTSNQKQRRPQSSLSSISNVSQFKDLHSSNQLSNNNNGLISNHSQNASINISQATQNSKVNANSIHDYQSLSLEKQRLNQGLVRDITFQQKGALAYIGCISNAHSNTIEHIEIDNYHANSIFSCSLDSTIKTWKIDNQIVHNKMKLLNNQSGKAIKDQEYNPNIDIKPVLTIPNKQHSKLHSLLFLSNINLLASGGQDKQIKLYNMKENGSVCSTIRGGHQGAINSLLRVDEDKLASGSADHFIRIFSINSKNLNTPILKFEQQNSGVATICSLDNNCIISCGVDRNVRIWDQRQANWPVVTFEQAHFDKINCIELMQQKQFMTGSDDGFINFWDIRTRKNYKTLAFENQKVSCAKFIRKQYLVAAHDNELTLLSSSDNFQKRTTFSKPHQKDSGLVSAESTYEDINQYKKEEGSIKTMAYSEQDRKIYTGGFNKKINVWSVDLNVL